MEAVKSKDATLRDTFAMAAMGMYFQKSIMDEKPIDPAVFGKDCYALADSMIAAREAK